MSTIWEKVGFGALWTLVGAGAAAVGANAYYAVRHNDDASEIAHLRGRVHDLEDKNDDLRKEAEGSRASGQAAGELVACRAQVEEVRRVQNTAAIQELRRLENAVTEDEGHLANGVMLTWGEKSSDKDDESTRDRILKERLTAERADLSAMRQKLVCAP